MQTYVDLTNDVMPQTRFNKNVIISLKKEVFNESLIFLKHF